MRVFFAIDLPQALRSRLGDIQRELRPAAPNARWVAPESIHLTLRFLGEINPVQMEEAAAALQGLTWKPFEVRARSLGFFPGARSPRVLWVGVEAASLEELAQEVNARMERLGFEPERRAFRPHLTLARSRDTRLKSELIRAAERFKDLDFGSFVADHLILFESVLKPAGAEYRQIREFAFVPGGMRT
ncbi:MAG TPA: RNA 2',3'-cyclic phosphodiesterase [Terriglobia bacterium]|nr:RNA 2',3'-cyclic phosphodiesterase [Terriglobia bacterium]